MAPTGRTRRQVYDISSTLSAVGLRGAARLCAVLGAFVCEDLVRVSLKLSVPRGHSGLYLCNFPLFCVLQKRLKIVVTCGERAAAPILITFYGLCQRAVLGAWHGVRFLKSGSVGGVLGPAPSQFWSDVRQGFLRRRRLFYDFWLFSVFFRRVCGCFWRVFAAHGLGFRCSGKKIWRF